MHVDKWIEAPSFDYYWLNQDTFDRIQEWHPIDDVQRTLFSRRDDLTAAEQRQYEQLNETSREIRRGLEPYKLTAQERELAVEAERKRYRKERRERSRQERFGDRNARARDECVNKIEKEKQVNQQNAERALEQGTQDRNTTRQQITDSALEQRNKNRQITESALIRECGNKCIQQNTDSALDRVEMENNMRQQNTDSALEQVNVNGDGNGNEQDQNDFELADLDIAGKYTQQNTDSALDRVEKETEMRQQNTESALEQVNENGDGNGNERDQNDFKLADLNVAGGTGSESELSNRRWLIAHGYLGGTAEIDGSDYGNQEKVRNQNDQNEIQDQNRYQIAGCTDNDIDVADMDVVGGVARIGTVGIGTQTVAGLRADADLIGTDLSNVGDLNSVANVASYIHGIEDDVKDQIDEMILEAAIALEVETEKQLDQVIKEAEVILDFDKLQHKIQRAVQ